MAKGYQLSVLLITYNRPEQVTSCVQSVLKALNQLPHLDWEILVGINGVDASTTKALETVNHPRVKVYPSTVRQTPAACRNWLLNWTKGNWIFFVDDDVLVPENLFVDFLESVTRYPEHVVFGGPNLTPPGSSLFQRSSGITLGSPFGTFFSSVRYRKGSPKPICDERSLTLCNLFIRRDVMMSDPYPPHFICCEENWVLQNIQRMGGVAAYEPDLMVWHDRRPDVLSFSQQVFRYGFGRGQIFKRRVLGGRWAHFFPLIASAYTLWFLVRLFSGLDVSYFHLMPFILYLSFCLLIALRKKFIERHSLAEVAVSTGLYPVVHLSYGIGMFWGIVRG